MTVQRKMPSLMGRVHDQFGHDNQFLILELSVEVCTIQFKEFVGLGFKLLITLDPRLQSLWAAS